MWAEQRGRQWWGTSEHILCQKRKFHTSHNFIIRQKNIYCDHEYCGVTRENTGVGKYLLWRLPETSSEAVIWHFWHRVVSSDFSGEISNLNRQIFWLIFFDTFWWSIALWKPSLYFDPSQIASVIIPGFSWWRDLRTQWEHGWLQAARPGQGPQDPDGLAAPGSHQRGPQPQVRHQALQKPDTDTLLFNFVWSSNGPCQAIPIWLRVTFLFSRHREQTPPARHGGYPGPAHVSPTRHSADRETRSPRSPGRYHQEAGMRTPGSRSRSRGHSRDRNSVHGGRSNRGYSRQGSIIG